MIMLLIYPRISGMLRNSRLVNCMIMFNIHEKLMVSASITASTTRTGNPKSHSGRSQWNSASIGLHLASPPQGDSLQQGNQTE